MQRNSRRLPEVIYIRRRVAALVVLLVLIGSVTSILVYINKSSSTEIITANTTTSQPTSTNKAEQTSASTSSSTGELTSESTGESTASAVGSSTNSTGETKPTPVKKDTCELQDLIVEAKSDQPNYATGDQPHFYLTVRNPTTADCIIDLREEQLRFEVYDLATNTRIWSDIDCNASEDTSARTFPAESERHYEAIWSRTYSSPGTCTGRQSVPSGSYLLYTLVGSNNSDGQTFNLN
ncbi:hypothetical protein [Corynebacterium freiburgense]|uniref:hypothetical protein n=1 Tax=Corynebacterium freiburgense TaxID=556548 RepID=UPI00047D93D2|nr:hypothetical protein [Corynebacterium freiburgense]WJZ03658.1 hypothetical protein CFREI_12005 [Corynebacterium freiburgense]